MAICEHERNMIEKYAAQITWPLGSQGVCDGLSGVEAANFADFTRFVEGCYKPVGNGGKAALGWSELSPEDVKRFSKWLPRG